MSPPENSNGGTSSAAPSEPAPPAKPSSSKGKKKDGKKDDDLSSEDQALKEQLELYVVRAQDVDPGVQKLALESMRQEIRSATSSMTSVPKPLKFLRPHYGTLKSYFDTMPESEVKKYMADILSVLALTMSVEGERESLRYRLLGSEGDIGSWGHEYVRNLAGEIAQEFQKRQGEEMPIDALMELVQQIVSFHMKGKVTKRPASGLTTEAMVPARRLGRDKAKSKKKHRMKPKVEAKEAEAGEAKPPVSDAGKPEESVREDGKAEEYVTVGSGTSAMNQEALGLSSTDNEDILQQVFRYKLDRDGNSFIPDKAKEKERREMLKAIQDDHVDKGKSALAKKTADKEEKDYASFRRNWESNCCNYCDHFDQRTMLGPMLYTHCTPGIVPYTAAETLEIFSMKLKLKDNNPGGFELPLSVYGMVAVRDTLDSRRNILFSCGRTEPPELTQDDPFLLLTGPSRAIMSADKVVFEIYLKVKDAATSQVKPLMTCARGYTGGSGKALCFGNVFCTLELCLRTVEDAVQATILGVQIVKKKELCPTNFTYGGQVFCTPLPRTDSGANQKIVLIKSKGRKMRQGDAGYAHLWRQVVSVPVGGALRLVIQAYGKHGAVAAEGHVEFRAQNCHVSQQKCIVGKTLVNVTVAWSVVPTDIDDVVYCSG